LVCKSTFEIVKALDTDVARGESLRARQLQALAAIPLVAGALAGCGGSDEPTPPAGKTVHGETETGMRLTVETFVDPGRDSRLSSLERWRSENGFPPVDYHRVIADNRQGQTPDSGRTVRFAANAQAIPGGGGIEARFTCDVLEYEWVPPRRDRAARWNALRKSLCADGPPKQDGIAPGARQVYYLVTDRGFSERGIRRMRVFGPRDAEFK
jgi:hypothetical protein